MHRTHYKNKIQLYKPLDKQVQWERRKIQQLQSSSLEELWLIPQSALYKYIYRWHNIPSMSGRVSCCTSATISSKVMSKGNICWFFFLINECFLDKINQASFYPDKLQQYHSIAPTLPDQVFQRYKLTIQDKPDCFDTYSKSHNNILL